MTEQEMTYSIALWLAKLLTDTSATTFKQKLTNVTDREGNKLGSFVLTFKKLKD